jgi:2'-5' RNA ligase
VAPHSFIRAFVCVSPPETELTKLNDFVASVREYPGFKWVKSDQLHITLKFLGDITSPQAMALDTNLSRLGGTRPFVISLRGVGAFPSESRPRTLWLGIGDGAESLVRLASFVDKASVSSGCERGLRKFHPHVTLARARHEGGEIGISGDLAEKLSDIPDISWTCGSFVLMKSELTSSGPVYTPMGKYDL